LKAEELLHNSVSRRWFEGIVAETPSTLGGIVVGFLGINSANVSRFGGQRKTYASGLPASTAPTQSGYSASRSKSWEERELPDDTQALAARQVLH
jgi:hypothetical protein